MNYFAHGRCFLDHPHFLAGTAVPDWLSVINRRARARSRLAEKFFDHPHSDVAGIARGIAQHHHDDRWFHATRAFSELSLEFTVAVRDLLPKDNGFRPSFLGHILVELLLDAALIEEAPRQLDAYYRAIDSLDPQAVSDAVSLMTTRPAPTLSLFIPRFSAERFLYDYLEDAKLLWRLNHVMRRVRLPLLPESLVDFFPDARRLVSERKSELLQPGENFQGV